MDLGAEWSSKKENKPMGRDNSVVIAGVGGGGEWVEMEKVLRINANGRNKTK